MERIVLSIAVVCLFAAPVLADLGTVNVAETGMGPNVTMTIHTAYPGGTQPVSNGKAVYVGIQHVSLTQASGHAWPSVGGFPAPGSIDTFCIDIWDWSTSTPVPSDVVTLNEAPDNHIFADIPGPMGTQKAHLLAELLNAHWPTVGPLDNTTAAALQAAVWEIVNEAVPSAPNGYDVNSGLFYLTGDGASARSLANTWLHALGSSLTGIDPSNYLAVTSECGQDYIVRVPVPAAVWLGVMGLSAAGLRLRKRA